MSRHWAAPVGLMLIVSLVACTGDSADDVTVTVLAAASLTETFEELEEAFEAEHEGVDLVFNFGSSGTLAEQAVQGAPGDLLATADEVAMSIALDGDAVEGDAVPFASNRLAIAVPAGNPADVASIDDLDAGGVTYAVCVDTAPCGKAAATVLDDAGIEQDPVSEEVDVKAVLQKVSDAQVDAGLVYVTDVSAAGDEVEGVDLPEAPQQTYPIGVLAQAREAELAQDFIDLLLSDDGRRVLAEAGFEAP